MLTFVSLRCLAQQKHYYRLAVDSVAVRVDSNVEADTFYVATRYYDCRPGCVILTRNAVFWSKDRKENGFIKVYNPYDTLCWDEGWIPTDTYERAVSCSKCKGKGTLAEPCKSCDGLGAWNCCHYKGLKLCSHCDGIGYR